jgi:non-canonical (house-cleaning) NTP pyrophosphatase
MTELFLNNKFFSGESTPLYIGMAGTNKVKLEAVNIACKELPFKCIVRTNNDDLRVAPEYPTSYVEREVGAMNRAYSTEESGQYRYSLTIGIDGGTQNINGKLHWVETVAVFIPYTRWLVLVDTDDIIIPPEMNMKLLGIYGKTIGKSLHELAGINEENKPYPTFIVDNRGREAIIAEAISYAFKNKLGMY